MTDAEAGGRPAAGDEEEPRVVVRDRRRIDPETGQVRTVPEPAERQAPKHAAQAEPGPAPVADEELAQLRKQLDERTSDLQRVSAEYANYRKRIDRDREVVITGAKAQVITTLLPVLDDLERAQAHGDLTGAFKSVADKLSAVLEQTGLESFGHEGEPFDPSVHEAVQHDTSPEVSGPTVTGVLRRGYKLGDRLVRAALVAVTDAETPVQTPAAQAPPEAPAPDDEPGAGQQS